MDIDANSGDVRRREHVLFIPVKETVYPTPFSFLVRKYVGFESSRDWQVDRVESVFRRVSPHFTYHGAISDCDRLTTMFEVFDVPEEQMRPLVTECLELLRTGKPHELGHLVTQRRSQLVSESPSEGPYEQYMQANREDRQLTRD